MGPRPGHVFRRYELLNEMYGERLRMFETLKMDQAAHELWRR
jgi:hypothetical protein